MRQVDVQEHQIRSFPLPTLNCRGPVRYANDIEAFISISCVDEERITVRIHPDKLEASGFDE